MATHHQPPKESAEPTLTLAEWEEPPVPRAELFNLFQTLAKGARAHRLYSANSPIYQVFHSNLRAAFAGVWDRVSFLQVTVDEHVFRCYGQTFTAGVGGEDLAFLFYRDGIRVITFLPGFEDEAERFLSMVDRASQLGVNSMDDVVTLLWEEEFSTFQYATLSVSSEGLTVARARGVTETSINPAKLRAAVESPLESELPLAVKAGGPPVVTTVAPENFVESAYRLEPKELEALERELELEWQRDTRSAVLDAVFDRLEDPKPSRQLAILHTLRQLMPVYLGAGDLATSARILTELADLVGRHGLEENEVSEVEALVADLSEPTLVTQLLTALCDGVIEPSEADLAVFLSHLRADTLPQLIRAAETSKLTVIRERLTAAIEALARANRDVLLGSIEVVDQTVSLGSTRIAGRLGLAEAVPKIAALLIHHEPQARCVAVDALAMIRTDAALVALQEAIEDPDRDVRIAAVRGLGSARYPLVRDRLEEAILSERLGEADLEEQIAFFEAYGSIANSESVKLLDRILNGRKLFAKQSAELRACAAIALGRAQLPAAREALSEAASDAHPMVRNAVASALGLEPQAR